MILTLAQIHARAAERPPGYVEDVLSRGALTGDTLELSEGEYRALCVKYGGPSSAIDHRPSAIPPPTLCALARNFAAEMRAWIAAGLPVRPRAQVAANLAICRACEHRRAEALIPTCKLCGCTAFKPWLATTNCPIRKWPAE